MEAVDTLDAGSAESLPSHGPAAGSAASVPRDAALPVPSRARTKAKPKKKSARAFWLKQLHTWHWMSAAISLAGMLLFAVTGLTLNHASAIGAKPVVVDSKGQLPVALVAKLPPVGNSTQPLPADVAAAVAKVVPLDPAGKPADWSGSDAVYVAMPGPGKDAWVSIDRASGAVTAEVTRRGWVSYLNDLHKGRNTGPAWGWFIDVFAIACVLFTLTGLFLLQLHARHRPLTWPVAGLSLLIPVVLALFFIH